MPWWTVQAISHNKMYDLFFEIRNLRWSGVVTNPGQASQTNPQAMMLTIIRLVMMTTMTTKRRGLWTCLFQQSFRTKMLMTECRLWQQTQMLLPTQMVWWQPVEPRLAGVQTHSQAFLRGSTDKTWKVGFAAGKCCAPVSLTCRSQACFLPTKPLPQQWYTSGGVYVPYILHTCQVRVTVDNSGLCCCTCVMDFE